MPKLPRLSIAAKLYTIFALLATATMALAFLAAVNSRQNTALTADFKQAFLGAQDVERVNGLVYAVVAIGAFLLIQRNLRADTQLAAHVDTELDSGLGFTPGK